MLRREIPGAESFERDHLLRGVNGTLGDRARLVDGVAVRFARAREELEVHLLSADPRGDLDNTAASLDLRGTHFEFFGVDDPHRGYDRLDLITAAIDELRADDPLGDELWPDAASLTERRPTVTVGVTHAPYQRVLNSFVNHGAQLMLAGHTHGGQVCVPGFGALVTNCDIPRDQVRGLSVWQHGLRSAFLNVSAGLGTSIYAPVRFACPPEATLLTLVPAG